MQSESEDDSNRFASSEGLIVSSSSRTKRENAADNSQFSWDILDNIVEKLDFDDLFQFAGVCKSWRAFHKIFWRTFQQSQAPLLVQISSYAKKILFFISLPDQKVYRSEMSYFWGLSCSGSSSGYLILTGAADKLVLVNPFTRRMKVITTLPSRGKLLHMACHALLAFAKGSEEFYIVAVCKVNYGLHVYQSHYSTWITLSMNGNPWKVADFVVLNNIIYVIDENAKIGVFSLTYLNIKFLKLNNIPSVSFRGLKLVDCDGQLLVVHFIPTEVFNVYKIDFSTMSYVKLETLGYIALFYTPGTNCYALSNPRRWGYSTNSLYYNSCFCVECMVYPGDGNGLEQCTLPKPSGVQEIPRSRLFCLDWYFKHQREEVDFSLVG